jgi:hypothetical protein
LDGNIPAADRERMDGVVLVIERDHHGIACPQSERPSLSAAT